MSWEEVSVQAYNDFLLVEPSDLVAALKHRFSIEQISRYFKASDYQFEGSVIRVRNDNSILIEFETLRAEHPKAYSAKQYRLLLLFSLHILEQVDNDIALDLNTIRRKDNIDRIVIWSCNGYDSKTIHMLKGNSIDVIWITQKDVAMTSSISHYIPVTGKDHNYALSLNLAADLLLKRLKKMFHLVLSEVAAPIYDDLYGKQKIATDEMMRFEEKIVRDTINQHLPTRGDRKIAVDVGCGTGRHTFPLAKQFERVYAFDFSPRMIEAAEMKKIEADLRNVLFSTADLEYEGIRDESAFQRDNQGTVDFVVASFGLCSFIEDTNSMLRRFHGWLREDGIVILSFYNKQTILLEITPNWRDTSLSAHLDLETSTLRVELSPRTIFHIYCQPFSQYIQDSISDVFEIQQITTFPTLMALMPNSLLQSVKALGLFRFVDETLAEHKDYKFGHYVTVVAKKRDQGTNQSFLRVKELLEEKNCTYEFLSHPPVISSDDVIKHLNLSDGLAVKTLLFRRRDVKKVIVVVVPSNKRIDAKKLARKAGVNKLYFASDRDVLAAGFPLGGIAPFAFNPESVEVFFLDKSIALLNIEWIYTGSGDNRRTLKIKRDDLLRLLENYVQVEV